MFSFSEQVLEHFYSPQNVGEFIAAENYIAATVSTPDKTTIMQLQIKMDQHSNKIIDAKFKTYGCPASIAISSWLTTWLQHKTLVEAASLSSDFLIKQFALPKEKYYCALLGEDLVKKFTVNTF